MIPREILEKVRRIEITTSRMVTDVFSGQYHSVFKGQGMEFDEVREYQIGDDVRAIDWNVTARTGRPHIKKYIEERELTVMILVDASRSCRFASVNQLKNKLAAEIAAVLSFAAIRNNDKVGLILFTDVIEKFIAPRKGVRHVLRVIRELLCFQPRGKGTDISAALDYLNKVTTRKTVAFMISDFIDFNSSLKKSPQEEFAFKKSLTVANKRHDMIAVTLNDPRETELPDCGLLLLEDAESGDTRVIDTSDPALRKAYREAALVRLRKREMLFGSTGVDPIDISTDKPYERELVKFFLRRRKRRMH
ncbi:MAG TPA: DUF58 domain-containing protein [Candidatus Omnitrophica bacterium]|nr:MAG: hypothetical protein A2Z81_06235 [Omnitrophica WOR_2 bacterium GWA2_45_18]HBR15829.1 DUF58 domain-containing protein [Candidatus Omnitrophota bacterium]